MPNARTSYVALLRGINVGGKNIIRMADLRDCMERAAFLNVATYIQSGNVVFASNEPSRAALVRRLETLLSGEFSYNASLVLRTQKEMEAVVSRAPDGFGAEPGKYRYDVLFLREPLTASVAIAQVAAKAGVDSVHSGHGVLYYRRLIARATESQLGKLTSRSAYQSMTVRNWNTTLRLLAMLSRN